MWPGTNLNFLLFGVETKIETFQTTPEKFSSGVKTKEINANSNLQSAHLSHFSLRV
jgi:hypothetical protein